jgi:hypothetical protein
MRRSAARSEFKQNWLVQVTSATARDDYRVALEFSDGSSGEYDDARVLTSDGEMVRPLRDPAFFRRLFVDHGVLCWPNGFEMDGHSLQAYIAEAGSLNAAPRWRRTAQGVGETGARYRAAPTGKKRGRSQ